MSRSNLKFYFDYISPNAYLAWTQLPRLIETYGIEVEPVPVLFAGLLDAHGQRGPAEIPAKMHWLVRDIAWKAQRLQVPIKPPATHPFNPLLALRVSSVPASASERSALITAIFAAVWARGKDVSESSVLAEVIAGVGLDADTVLAQAASAQTKHRLRECTDDAIAAGIFGVPSMLVGGNLFWGYDDFSHLQDYLNGKVLPESDLQAWAGITASARRKNVS